MVYRRPPPTWTYFLIICVKIQLNNEGVQAGHAKDKTGGIAYKFIKINDGCITNVHANIFF